VHQQELTGSLRVLYSPNGAELKIVSPQLLHIADRSFYSSTWARSPIRGIWTPAPTRRVVIQSLYAYSFWTNCSMTTTLPPRARSPVHGSNLKLSGSYGSQTNMGLNLIKNRLGGMARAPNALPRFRQAAALRHHLRPRLQSGRGVGWGRAGCPRSGVEEPSRLMGGLAAAWPLCSLAACRRFEK